MIPPSLERPGAVAAHVERQKGRRQPAARVGLTVERFASNAQRATGVARGREEALRGKDDETGDREGDHQLDEGEAERTERGCRPVGPTLKGGLGVALS